MIREVLGVGIRFVFDAVTDTYRVIVRPRPDDPVTPVGVERRRLQWLLDAPIKSGHDGLGLWRGVAQHTFPSCPGPTRASMPLPL